MTIATLIIGLGAMVIGYFLGRREGRKERAFNEVKKDILRSLEKAQKHSEKAENLAFLIARL